LNLIHLLVEPPGCLLLTGLAGAALWRRRPRLGRLLVFGALALCWIASTPCCGGILLRALQVDPPLVPGERWPEAEAVVVLAAGTLADAPEYGGPTVDRLSLERLRYGIAVQRATGRPLLVTGGPAAVGLPSVAELMRRVAEDEFGVPVRFVEGSAVNTAENAARSAALLRAAGIGRVYLVTHAWHLPRARAAFAAAGLEVVAAPTGFRGPLQLSLAAFLPSAKGLRDTNWAWHEGLGRVWYALGGG
jgi:uncharacterized SAM-binding protein YcdF (DUF218 family)